MSRSRLLLVALILLCTGAFVYFLAAGVDPQAAAASVSGRHPGNPDLAWPPRQAEPPAPFTFEHEGKSVTLDLSRVRRAHRFLQRLPAEPGEARASAPDFAFDFLQWPARKFTGTETIKTRRCWVVDLTNPSPAPAGPHMLVRLFVDQETGSFMRLNAYNFDGKKVLDYSVQSGMRVAGELAVKSATARHFQPGTSKVQAEVEYLAQSPGKP